MNIFQTSNKEMVSKDDLMKTLDQLKVYDTDYLYVHTGMTFGMPNPSLGRKKILEEILNIFQEFNIKNICFPTFTFSFCNGESYNVQKSKSKMGALNEYVRLLPNSVRSIDPLMSNVLIGEDLDLVTNLSKSSISKGSTFDKLHNNGKVKFLFFGTKVGDCFTYMHYIEKMVNAKYRYDRVFEGQITDGDSTYFDAYELFVRYKDIYAGEGSYVYEQIMIDKGISERLEVGDSTITILDEPNAYELYYDLITKNPNYFLDPKSKFTFDKTFEVKDMVAL
jgi:aminoglycoside 3-N-acetyltransferase